LGLTIVKRAVEQHGGTISEDGEKGARFNIQLPRR
jgi:signal transduction histidine kinase